MTRGRTGRRTGSWCGPWCCWRSWSAAWRSCTAGWTPGRPSGSWAACRPGCRTCWGPGGCSRGRSSSAPSCGVSLCGWRTKPSEETQLELRLTRRLRLTDWLTDLYPGLAQLGPLAELLPGVDVRVLGPLEGLLQLVQLVGGEGRPGPSLLPLQWDPGLGLGVRALLRTLGFDWNIKFSLTRQQAAAAPEKRFELRASVWEMSGVGVAVIL